MGRKPRHLRPEEQALWKKVTEKATPLHPDKPPAPMIEDMASGKAPILPEVENPRLPMFRLGQKVGQKSVRFDLLPSISSRLAETPVQMDQKAFDRMKRGKLVPEARIDLHGMTLAQAHPTLITFILSAHTRQLRLVLVITGKGKLGTDGGWMLRRRGVIKQQVPQWLSSAPIGPLVLQVSESHLRHGGTGAYYVYLRRHR